MPRWEGWHSLGGKFYTSSPVSAAHINADEYFGQTIAVLFQSQLTQPYWFTRQMRLLIFRLYKMSNEVHYPFARVWYATTSFSHPFRSQEVTRSLYYCFTSEEWEHIHTDTDIVDMTEEEIVPGVWLPFVLAAWQPNGSDAKRAFADMQKHIQRNDIYFAAQYDTNPPSFHVNTWSEILRS